MHHPLLVTKQYADAFLGDCYFGNSIIWGAQPCLLDKKQADSLHHVGSPPPCPYHLLGHWWD